MALAHDRARRDFATWKPRHFLWSVSGKVATITLNRPERKNPLTFEVYAELRDLFRELAYADATSRPWCITGAGGNFCSGGDVHEIIGPLCACRKPRMRGLLAFTRMTGDLVKAMRACPQPIVAAVDGVCAGAGAILAMASDLRFGTAREQGRLSVRPRRARRLRHGRLRDPAAHHRRRAAPPSCSTPAASMDGDEAERWGFYNRLCAPGRGAATRRRRWPRTLAAGPTFAHAMTKTMLHQEWGMAIDEAIEAEAQAQAICMQTKDFGRAYEAFVAKRKPVFEGN